MHPRLYGMVKLVNVQLDFLVTVVLLVQPQDIGIPQLINACVKASNQFGIHQQVNANVPLELLVTIV